LARPGICLAMAGIVDGSDGSHTHRMNHLKRTFLSVRNKMAWPLLSASIAVSLAGCKDANPSAARFEETACPQPIPSGLIEGKNVRCGSLIVPENRANPDQKRIALAVIIVRGTDNPAPDPIVHLIGGPGGSYQAYASVLGGDFGLGMSKRTGRELIIFDQRGTGYSKPFLGCKSDETLEPCLTRLQSGGIDLASYNTEESAGDVEDLRRALGYEKVNLYGQSYGTTLAQTVMRLYPQGLRSIVLESVSSVPHDSFLTNSAKSLQLALERVFAECAADAECANAFPDPSADLQASLTWYAENNIDAAIFVNQLTTLTQFSQGKTYVPLFLRAIATNDPVAYEGVTKVIAGYEALQANVQVGFSELMFVMMSCYDYASLLTAARDEAVNGDAPPAFRAALPDRLTSVCAVLPPGRVSEAQRQPFTSEIPTLLISGSHDSNTPLEIAQALGPSLINHHHVVVPGWGHPILSLGEPCSTDVMRRFINDPSGAPSTECLKKTIFPTTAP